MPRPRTPTNILRLNGALARNPGRHADRLNEPVPSGPVGSPPDWMNDAERESWGWIVGRCPPGVLSNADDGILELAAYLRAQVVGRTMMNGGRIWALLRQCYGELGMTPASRSKVQVATVAGPNRFAAIDNEFAD